MDYKPVSMYLLQKDVLSMLFNAKVKDIPANTIRLSRK